MGCSVDTVFESKAIELKVGDKVTYSGLNEHPQGTVIGIDSYQNIVGDKTVRWTSYTITSSETPDKDPYEQMQNGARWWLTNKPGVGLVEWVWRGHAEGPADQAYALKEGDISIPEAATLVSNFSGTVQIGFDGKKGVSVDTANVQIVENPDNPDEWLGVEEFIYQASGKRGCLSFTAKKIQSHLLEITHQK